MTWNTTIWIMIVIIIIKMGNLLKINSLMKVVHTAWMALNLLISHRTLWHLKIIVSSNHLTKSIWSNIFNKNSINNNSKSNKNPLLTIMISMTMTITLNLLPYNYKDRVTLTLDNLALPYPLESSANSILL